MFVEMPNQFRLKSIFTFITKKVENGFYFAGESHPFWEMVYVVDGNVGVTADDRIYNLSSGDIIFHKPMEFHRIWAGDGTAPGFVVISFEAEGSGVKQLENRVVKCDEHIAKLMEDAVRLRNEGFVLKDGLIVEKIIDEYTAFVCAKKLEMLICRAMYTDDFIEATDDRDALLFGRAVTCLKENIREKMSVEDVASRCFVSSSKIKKVFSKYASCGVSEYFMSMKITAARTGLSSGQSVASVSESLGFSNQFYFSTVFKKITGVTPSQFKKANKENNIL